MQRTILLLLNFIVFNVQKFKRRCSKHQKNLTSHHQHGDDTMRRTMGWWQHDEITFTWQRSNLLKGNVVFLYQSLFLKLKTTFTKFTVFRNYVMLNISFGASKQPQFWFMWSKLAKTFILLTEVDIDKEAIQYINSEFEDITRNMCIAEFEVMQIAEPLCRNFLGLV